MADVKLLNQQRWMSHIAAQRTQSKSGFADPPWGAANHKQKLDTVPTAGALFNRPNPIAHDHDNQEREYVTHPYNRKLDKFLKRRGEKRAIRPDGTYYDYDERKEDQRKQLDERDWDRDAYVKDRAGNPVQLMPVSGSDMFSLNEASYNKSRIPNTSVVNKIGDLRVPFCCWGIRLTAAQWSTLTRSNPHAPLKSRSRVCVVRARSLVDQFNLLPRTHVHGLPDAAHGLLALGPVHVDGHRARDRAHLSHLSSAHAAAVCQQRVALVAGVQWLAERQWARHWRQRALAARQHPSGELCNAHPQLLCHLRRLPPLGAPRGHL